MLQKTQVHLVPTDKPSTLGINKDTGHMYQFDSVVSHEGRYLYFTSDKEIKEPCWALVEGELKYLSRVVNSFVVIGTSNTYSVAKSRCRKIVATTNKDLLLDYNKEGDGGYENFPCIPESFIKLYVERYNTGNPIKEVELETYTPPYTYDMGIMGHMPRYIKLDSQGCVIVVNPFKNLYKTALKLLSNMNDSQLEEFIHVFGK